MENTVVKQMKKPQMEVYRMKLILEPVMVSILMNKVLVVKTLNSLNVLRLMDAQL